MPGPRAPPQRFEKPAPLQGVSSRRKVLPPPTNTASAASSARAPPRPAVSPLTSMPSRAKRSRALAV